MSPMKLKLFWRDSHLSKYQLWLYGPRFKTLSASSGTINWWLRIIHLQGIPAITDKFNGLADQQSFLTNAAVCGICYYFYNEMQNIVLGSLGAVPTAVGNTLKRVVIFVALYFFTTGETFPMPKIVGCGIAIAGCLAFAVFDSKKW